VAVDAASGAFACGTSHGCVLIFDPRSRALRHRVDVARRAVAALAFAPGGRYLVVRSADGFVHLLDALCGFERVAVLQRAEGVRAAPGFVWPCHDILLTDAPQVREEREGAGAPLAPAPAVHAFLLATLEAPNALALYLVQPPRPSLLLGRPGAYAPDKLATIPLDAPPLCLPPPPAAAPRRRAPAPRAP
jgi:hypothetical protein